MLYRMQYCSNNSLAGVHSVLVALLAEKADIQYDSELTDPNQLVGEINSLGFGASLLSDSEGYQQGKVDLTVCLIHENLSVGSFSRPNSRPRGRQSIAHSGKHMCTFASYPGSRVGGENRAWYTECDCMCTRLIDVTFHYTCTSMSITPLSACWVQRRRLSAMCDGRNYSELTHARECLSWFFYYHMLKPG